MTAVPFGKQLQATQGSWLQLMPLGPSMQIRLVLSDLEKGHLQAFGRRIKRRGIASWRVRVWDVRGASQWFGELEERGAPVREWRRCRPLECLLAVLNYDAVTVNFPTPPMIMEALQ